MAWSCSGSPACWSSSGPAFAAFNPAAILVLLAGFGYAITMIATKKLTATETTFGIIFWMAVIQFPLSHYCLSNAFRSGDASLVVPLDFMRIPLIAVVGWAFYGERLDVFVFLGALIIISGVVWNLRAESKRHRKIATEADLPAPQLPG